MLPIPNCWERGCKHFEGAHQPDGTEESEVVVCKAFPEGIPNEIAYGDDLHLKPWDSQKNNLTFEPTDSQ